MMEYIRGIVPPKIVAEEAKMSIEEVRQNQVIADELTKETLQKYGLTCICSSTVYRWMKCLGFNYEARKKCYYVDHHEKPSTIEYRWKFVERYLQAELKMHRWIQVSKEDAKRLKEDSKVATSSGYYYYNVDNKLMVEFHVDDCSEFLTTLSNIPFRGMLSVRKAPEVKPLICFGHNECIFKQFVLTSKAWKGPNGENAPVPKDDGAGIMISAFQSREFGFGLHLCDEELKEVNK